MRNKLLKICAAAAMLLVPLPIMSLFDVLSTEQFSPLKYLAYYCFCWLPIILGYLAARFRRNQSKPKALVLARITLAAGVVLLAVITPIGLKIAENITDEKLFTASAVLSLLPAVMTWYVLGIKLNEKSYSEVFTFPWLGAYLTESFLCYIFAAVQQMMDTISDSELSLALSGCRSLIAVLLIIIAMLTVLLINQSNIDTQVNRRKNTNLIIPRGLRAHNARIIIIVCAVILALMLCKDMIAAFLEWIAQTTAKIADMLLMNIRMQTSQPENGSSDLSLGQLFSNNEGVDILLYVVLAAAVIAVIALRKKIAALFRALAAKLFGKLSAPPENTADTENYTDYYESITEHKQRNERLSTSELLKKYKKESDPAEKYRIGYRLYLIWLSMRSKKLSPAFTVEEQSKEAARLYNGECDINEIAEKYSDIRYHDQTIDQTTDMDSLIEELYK